MYMYTLEYARTFRAEIYTLPHLITGVLFKSEAKICWCIKWEDFVAIFSSFGVIFLHVCKKIFLFIDKTKCTGAVAVRIPHSRLLILNL